MGLPLYISQRRAYRIFYYTCKQTLKHGSRTGQVNFLRLKLFTTDQRFFHAVAWISSTSVTSQELINIDGELLQMLYVLGVHLRAGLLRATMGLWTKTLIQTKHHT